MSVVVRGPNGVRIGVLHFPKTAGTWLRHALRDIPTLTVRRSPVRLGYSRHCGLEGWAGEVPEITHTVVRRPDEWLESWWRYQMPNFPYHEPENQHPCRWSDELAMEVGTEIRRFDVFVRAVLDRKAEHFVAMYDGLVRGVDHLWKMESLPAMLEHLCGQLGLPERKAEMMLRVRPVNVSKKIPAEWGPGQREMFRSVMARAFAIYQSAK